MTTRGDLREPRVQLLLGLNRTKHKPTSVPTNGRRLTQFHALQVGRCPVGNSYLTRLGFSYDPIIYMTSREHNDVVWLTKQDADKIGVTYSVVPSDSNDPRPFGGTSATPINPPSQVSPPTQQAEDPRPAIFERAKQFFARTEARESADGALDIYANSVSYYGKSLTREQIVSEKLKYVARWPQRHYTILTIDGQCRAHPYHHVCNLYGLVGFEAQGAPGWSRGVAAYQVELTTTDEGKIFWSPLKTAELCNVK